MIVAVVWTEKGEGDEISSELISPAFPRDPHTSNHVKTHVQATRRGGSHFTQLLQATVITSGMAAFPYSAYFPRAFRSNHLHQSNTISCLESRNATTDPHR
jgi:hypothetical protein